LVQLCTNVKKVADGFSTNNNRLAALEAKINHICWFLYISVPVVIFMFAKIEYDINYKK